MSFFTRYITAPLTSLASFFTSTHNSPMPAIAPLQFLTFTNNLSSFAALVDPGSQLNLVSHAVL
jgi:hypothetical protein